MNNTIGFIGCGNMGSAMIKGVLNAGVVKGEQLYIIDRDLKKMEVFHEQYGVNASSSIEDLVLASDIIFLAIKPKGYEKLLKSIKPIIDNQPQKVVVSIAAGITLGFVEKIIGLDKKVMRSMPNTPALVNAGMSALCPNKNISEEESVRIKEIFESFGEAEFVDEDLFHSVIGVSGSSPAYVFKFIEALADGAVLGGMKREKAYKFAAQAVLGSAKLLMETGLHPGALKDMVCSPGGTTIEAIASLEKNGFSGTVIEAMTACMEKSKEME